MNAATESSSSPVDEENPTSQELRPEIRIQMPQPQPLPQPQPEPEPESEPESESEPEPEPQLQLQAEQQPQPPQPEPEQQPQPQPELQPEPQPQLQTEQQPQPQLQTEQQPQPELQPEPQPQSTPPPNLPAGNLLRRRRRHYNRTCVPLYQTLMKGDWEAAKVILRRNRELVRSSITENCETPLHVAASAKSTKSLETFVRYLVTNLMTPADLALQNVNHNTALCLAAAAGNVEVARIMVGQHNHHLLTIPGRDEMMPLYVAALFGRRDMVNYLYDESENMNGPLWTDRTRDRVLVRCTEAGFFDIALKIVQAWPRLAKNNKLLGILAGNTDAFTGTKPRFFRIRKIFAFICRKDGPDAKESQALQLLRTIWKKIVKLGKKKIDTIIKGPADKIREPANQNTATYSSQALFVAAEMGNTKFVVELVRQYPDLIWKKNDDKQSIFHVAVSHRQEGIYNLLYEIGSMKDAITFLKDVNKNNMLHLVGKIAKKKQLEKVSGVALQMQRELLWFKEVEAMIPPSYRERKNNDGLTPHELFTEEHKDLMSQGEKWMKHTASHCMVVATLIATMVFAAAFTIPGGYNTGNGIPELRKKRAFIAFVISDAISLFSSSSSILIFLSILTSRYAEHDFMESLPKKLIRGLATLFLSMISMMVAFSVSFFALYYHHLLWVPVTISIFPVIPTFLYLRFQYPLLADVYRWTYGSRNLFKPKKFMLY